MKILNKSFSSTLAFIAGFVLVLLIALSFGFDSKIFSRTNMRVTSLDSEDENQQFTSLKNEILAEYGFLQVTSLWDVDIQKILKEVKRKAWIEEAQINRLFPNKLTLGLSLKKIALLYVDDAGIWLPISNDGMILPKMPDMKMPDVPFLRGRKFYENKSSREKAVALLKLLPATGWLSQQTVGEIYLDSKNGFELLLNKNGTKVILGNDNYDLKIKRAGKVVEYLEAKNIIGRVIDARFEKKILVRLRKGT